MIPPSCSFFGGSRDRSQGTFQFLQVEALPELEVKKDRYITRFLVELLPDRLQPEEIAPSTMCIESCYMASKFLEVPGSSRQPSYPISLQAECVQVES